MKYRLDDQEMVYLTNILGSMAHAPGVNRHARRNILRLANKVTPPRTHIYLKPYDKQQLLGIVSTGLKIMKEALEKEADEAHRKNGEAIQLILTGTLAKLQ